MNPILQERDRTAWTEVVKTGVAALRADICLRHLGGKLRSCELG
jgi:hypothetical protein